jgi:hypothetical protein
LNIFGESFKPTSGLRGVLLALLTCDHVDVYGFGTHKVFGNGHYFQEARMPILENVGHNYSVEHELMKTLSDHSQCQRYFSTLACEFWLATTIVFFEYISYIFLFLYIGGTLTLHMDNAVSDEPIEDPSLFCVLFFSVQSFSPCFFFIIDKLTHRKEVLKKKLENLKAKGIVLDEKIHAEVLKHL